MFAGDLLEADATPYFGDAYPIDWPATVERLVELADRDGRARSRDGRRPGVRGSPAGVSSARLPSSRRLVDAGVIGIDAAVLRTPYPADAALEPLTRALAQLRGELD